MTVSANSTERKNLIISSLGNLVLGCVGVIFAALSSSSAIMLDGVFNLIYFATGLFTLKVARIVLLADDERFPYGYAFFEPLVNLIKGILVFGVSVMAVIGAVEAFIAGGRPIEASLAVIYGVFATVVCWLLAFITRIGVKKTGSPLLQADAENWVVNAAISSAVLLAFIGIIVIKKSPLAHLAPYVDPSLVLIVVLITISVPARMAWRALMEMLNRAPDPDVIKEVRDIVETAVATLPVRDLCVRTIQPGRTRFVIVHVLLPDGYAPETLAPFDAIRTKALSDLQMVHPETIIDFIFTSDPKWLEPTSPNSSG